jgi:DNA-directed RNA polymerase subunit RPC12/RpoP
MTNQTRRAQDPVKKFIYKACPRCNGDLVVDADVELSLIIEEQAGYICLQCGRHVSPEALREVTGSAHRTAAQARAA